MNTRSTHLAHLGHAIEQDGLAPHEAAVARIVALGLDAGVSQVLLAVAADRSQPEVARTRALGRVLVALEGSEVALTPARSDLVVVA